MLRFKIGAKKIPDKERIAQLEKELRDIKSRSDTFEKAFAGFKGRIEELERRGK